MSTSALTVRSLTARAVNVPLRIPLQTSGGTIRMAPLALVDLRTEEGITGRSYLFCYTPLVLKPVCELLGNLEPVLRGTSAAPLELGRALNARFRLLGTKGIVGMALAGIDMAAWDALAKLERVPLARALGADPVPVRAYNSCGLGLVGADAAPAGPSRLLRRGSRRSRFASAIPTSPPTSTWCGRSGPPSAATFT
jgi:mandelate racemase